MNKIDHRPLKVAALVSAALCILKAIAYFASGSMLVLTSLLDSLADTVNSIVNIYVQRFSLTAPDREHPFGHGGFEVVGSIIQGMVIIFFGLSLLQESYHNLIHSQSHQLNMTSMPLSSGILVVSALVGFWIHRYLGQKIEILEKKGQRSLSLLSDKAHYAGDAAVNALAAGGVILVFLTRADYIDGIFGIVGGCFLTYTGIPVLVKCFNDIVHNEAPVELQQKIVDVTLPIDQHIKGIHLLRSRQLGPTLFVDFHMKVSDDLTIKESHEIVEKVEKMIKKAIPLADVLIHLDPASEVEHDEITWNPSYSLPRRPYQETVN